MPTRLDSIVVDAADPVALGSWWARALGWTATVHRWTNSDGTPGVEVSVEPDPSDRSVDHPDSGDTDSDDNGTDNGTETGTETGTGGDPDSSPDVPLLFGPSNDPKLGVNRVHLDLRSLTLQEQEDIVSTLEQEGARRVDIGQGTTDFVVLADPEGNEFCVLEPRETYATTTGIAAIVVKAIDPPSLARFWASASGWGIVTSTPEYTALQQVGGTGPLLEMIATTEKHRTKNRWHLDVRPGPDDDHAAEVERLIALGAEHVDVGQSQAPDSDVTWVVLADPEGNEFCVLRPA